MERRTTTDGYIRRGLAPERDRPHRHRSIRVGAGRPTALGDHSLRPLAPDERSPETVDAVQDLITLARTERARMSLLSPHRAYYVGVEAAAEQVLHPEVDSVSNVGWLERHHPAFVSGYVQTAAMLAPLWS